MLKISGEKQKNAVRGLWVLILSFLAWEIGRIIWRSRAGSIDRSQVAGALSAGVVDVVIGEGSVRV